MQPIRIGIVGLGNICRRRHVPGLQKIEGVQITAVANRTRASAERAAREFHIPDVCDSWQELITRNDLDAVLIGTWPYLHCEVSVAALEAGKHVFCQARMARNLDEAQRMVAAARKACLVTALCPVPIGMSVDNLMCRLLRENTIGPIRYVCVRSMNNLWVNPEAPITWRKDDYLSGLNMHTLGMYIEVIHRWFGWTTEVTGKSFIYTKYRKDASGERREVRVPDQIILDTVVGTALPVHYVISNMSEVPSDTIEIFGENGALRYDANADMLYNISNDTVEPIVPGPDEYYDVNNWTVETDFISAIRFGTPYHPDFEDGLQYMAVIQAAYDSDQAGRRIQITL